MMNKVNYNYHDAHYDVAWQHFQECVLDNPNLTKIDQFIYESYHHPDYWTINQMFEYNTDQMYKQMGR
jgi:hypothetical protein